MGKQIIWYNSAKCKYYFGTVEEFKLVRDSEEIIVAEEFANMPIRFVKKITRSLNDHLMEQSVH